MPSTKTTKEKEVFSKNDSTAIKGIAIIMMLLHHCFRDREIYEGFAINFYPFSENMVNILGIVCKMCVGMFVFITGYGLSLSLRKINKDYQLTVKETCQWTVNRAILVLSGFWIISFPTILIGECIDGRASEVFFEDGTIYGFIQILFDGLGLSNIMRTCTYLKTWWYMSAAIVFIFLLPVLGRMKNKIGYFFLIISIILFPRVLGLDYVGGTHAFSYFIPLVLGMMCSEYDLFVKLKQYHYGIKKGGKIFKFIFETCICILIPVLYYETKTDRFWELKFGVLPVLFIFYCYAYIVRIPVMKQILYFLGRHSMNIFLIHNIYRNLYLTEFIYSFKHFALCLLVLLALSLATSILIEGIKKIIGYDKLIKKLCNYVTEKINCGYDKK